MLIASDSSTNLLNTHLIQYKKIKQTIQLQLEYFESLKKQQVQQKNNSIVAPETLQSFLQKYNLLYDLPFKFYYLLQAKMLTIWSENKDNHLPTINYAKIINNVITSKTQAVQIVKNFQSNLSLLSFQFAKNLVQIINLSNKSDEIIPCYDVMSCILEHQLLMNSSILFVINRGDEKLKFLFSPDADRKNFKKYIATQDKLYLPCLVISGESMHPDATYESKHNYIERFLSFNIRDIILGNFANHPQLPNNHCNDKNFVGKDDFNYSKIFGLTNGCSLDNYSLFLIKHIYCDTIFNQLAG